MAVTYIAVVGVNWTDSKGEHRAEPGEPVPASVIKRSPWLLEQGAVRAEGVADGPSAR